MGELGVPRPDSGSPGTRAACAPERAGLGELSGSAGSALGSCAGSEAQGDQHGQGRRPPGVELLLCLRRHGRRWPLDECESLRSARPDTVCDHALLDMTTPRSRLSSTI